MNQIETILASLKNTVGGKSKRTTRRRRGGQIVEFDEAAEPVYYE
jgi:hypothetical protein